LDSRTAWECHDQAQHQRHPTAHLEAEASEAKIGGLSTASDRPFVTRLTDATQAFIEGRTDPHEVQVADPLEQLAAPMKRRQT